MNSIAFINDKFFSLDEAIVNVEDRGYQFGDGVYEVVFAYNGIPFALKEHLDRFFNSLKLVKIKHCYSKEEIVTIIENALKKTNFKEAEIYFQMTRGTSRRSHPFPPADVKSNFVLTIHPAVAFPEELWKKGVAVRLVEDIRWGHCDIKSINLLPNVLAKQEAIDGGDFEAVMYRGDKITEGSSTNVFIISNEELITTPNSNQILPGITRMHIISLAKELGIKATERHFSIDEFLEADEAFLTGTWIEVLPINKVDSKLINKGEVGPISKRLQQGYRKWISNCC